MAEQRINSPVTPEITDPKKGKAQRSFTGGTNTSRSDEKILPHYLRASTGSCHDFCKFGREHAFKAKEKRPSRKGITVTFDKYQRPVEIVTPIKRDKKPAVKSIPSPDPKVQIMNTPKVITRGTQLAKQKPLSSAKGRVDTKLVVTYKEKPISPAKKSEVVAKVASFRPKHVTGKSPSSPLNPSRGPSTKSSSFKTIENNGVSKLRQKKAAVLPKISVSPKPSVKRVTSFNASKYRNTKGSSPLKNQSKVRKSLKNISNDSNVSEKTLYVVELKPAEKSLGSTISGTPTSLSSSSSPPLLSPSSSMNEEDNTSSESTLEDENKSGIEMSNGGRKQRSGRVATNLSEEKDQACKLSFRRGKVVNPQSEYNSPRKLRFRQGRVLGDNGKSDSRRKSFKKREVGGDTTNAKSVSEKVVLRHQDGNGKKGSQGLFNNVIEETASKLVETRKSKVKALVGAFETVISLQESKPSPTSMT